MRPSLEDHVYRDGPQVLEEARFGAACGDRGAPCEEAKASRLRLTRTLASVSLPCPKLCSRLYPLLLSTLNVSFSIFLASGEGLERGTDVTRNLSKRSRGFDSLPVKGAARQPEASLAWTAATLFVKRRQQVLKPCGKPRDEKPAGAFGLEEPGAASASPLKVRTCRLGRGLGARQRHGMDRQAT